MLTRNPPHELIPFVFDNKHQSILGPSFGYAFSLISTFLYFRYVSQFALSAFRGALLDYIFHPIREFFKWEIGSRLVGLLLYYKLCKKGCN